MAERSYQETIDYLYGLVPAYQEIGSMAIKNNLDNIVQLCAHLGHPQDTYPSVHIAGTNGKGTTAHMISAILQEAGYSVGLYTSPHYVDFRERIKVDGKMIKEKQVIKFINTHEELIKKVKPSFFEVTVAMAFDFFSKKDVDFAIVETGLGGRLDSTNILLPLLSVITHISLDHQQSLGSDVYTIAGEKAGIIKFGVPVVIGRHQPSCDHVFMSRAASLEARLNFASLEVKTIVDKETISFVSVESTYKIRRDTSEPFFQENATTAIRAIEMLTHDEDIIVADEEVSKGLENYKKLSSYIGRWTIHQESPRVISDSAHNIDAFKKILAELGLLSFHRIHFILGFVDGKEVENMLGLLDRDHQYYITAASPERSMKLDSLSEIASSIGLSHTSYDSVELALTSALEKATDEDIIYVGGSSYLVGDLLAYYKSKT